MTETRRRRGGAAPMEDAGGAMGEVATWAGVTRVWATAAGVTEVRLPDWHAGPAQGTEPPQMTIRVAGSPEAARHVEGALRELADYFAGARRVFTVALAPEGPAFQRAAWAAVARVPFGETRSYLDIARELGDPAATRAVGLANGANPLAPIVPCHRIVGSDGRLTGYGPGLALKRRLLALEGAMPATAEDYDAWAAGLAGGTLLGVRATGSLCRPTCARARRHADRCPRLFTSLDDGLAAGFAPCARCRPDAQVLL